MKKHIINKLPVVLQTKAQKEFFDATFDQLFSQRNVEQLEGFVGRREGGIYNVVEDNYKSEPTVERGAYQLEPIAVSQNADGEESNQFFYQDLINYMRFRKGDVSNHHRIFSDNYYSFAPPIDVDKFVNYPNYIWIPNLGDFPVLEIPDLSESDVDDLVVNQQTYIVEQWQPPIGGGEIDFALSSGMIVRFPDGGVYDDDFFVEGVGRSIELVPVSSTIREDEDYVTIERCVVGTNDWSESNHWIHKEVVEFVNRWVGLPDSIDPSRKGRRPIIEFERRLELFAGISKTEVNQPPKFQLYNWQGISLSDPLEFPNAPENAFTGNEIFSYGRDTTTFDAPIDNVLGFAPSYQTNRSVGDIQFINRLDTESYSFQRVGSARQPIRGYLFYAKQTASGETEYRTAWKSSDGFWKQRVLDKYLGDGETRTFIPSVTPEDGDFNVKINGIMVGTDLYVYDDTTNTVELEIAPEENDVVEIRSFTNDSLPEDSNGYFEIPPALQNNPNNNDIRTITWDEINRHFVSIIENQENFTGSGFGAGNNYRDTRKNTTLGAQIVQTQSPLIKTMLMCSNPDLDIIRSLRFSSQEYIRYKNKLIKQTQLMINEGYQPAQITGEFIPTTEWLDEAINRVIKGREHNDAFADTQMLAWSNLYEQEQITVLAAQQSEFTLERFIDLSDQNNQMYVYVEGVLQVIDVDYKIIASDSIITVEFVEPLITNTEIVFRLFKDISPAHIPATSAKLGITPVYYPRIELDPTYPTATEVLIGHDGSRTILYGSIVDEVLLEFERRIYNGIVSKFRVDHDLPVSEDEIRPGFFRSTGWTRSQWLDLIKPNFLKWSTYNALDFRVNEFYDETDPWTWNYTGIDFDGYTLNGSWRNIFEEFYDTHTPDLTPWEMLGFPEKPSWWEDEYGSGPWPAPADLENPDENVLNEKLWIDIENGVIRQGNRAGQHERYSRPNLIESHLPVDQDGILKPTPLECIGYTDDGLQQEQYASSWTFGDQGPIEHLWRTTDSYRFHLVEGLFIGRPAEFGEKFWDPEQFIRAPADNRQILSLRNNAFRRIGNRNLLVHGEESQERTVVRTGYQVWITSHLRSLNKDITRDFGTVVRNLNVKLGHKMAGFTNPQSLRAFLGGISTGSRSRYILLPDENVRVSLYTSPPIREYFYGGVLIRGTEDGRFQIYGYDALSEEFNYFPRIQSARDERINIGGEAERFRLWQGGTSYNKGDLVKLNKSFYRARESHLSTRFEQDKWQRLDELPIVGGIRVIFRPVGDTTTTKTVDYGTILDNPQQVVDFLIGYGQWLESQGFVFDRLNEQNGRLENWRLAAEQFLFWAGTNFEANSAITLSPASGGVKVEVNEGYPANIERVINGVYSILDGNGTVIDPINTNIIRENRTITCIPIQENVQSIHALRVNTTETESVITFDNITKFGDLLYNTTLGTRVPRLALRGERTLDWTGKLEAGGYIITANKLIPNYEHLTNRIRNYHNTEVTLNDPSVSAIAQHLIGFNQRDYMDNMDILDNNQYMYYRGMIRDKGNVQAIQKIMRARTVSSGSSDLQYREDWGLKLGEFGTLCNETTTEVLLPAREVTSESQQVVINYKNLPIEQITSDTFPAGSILIQDENWLTKPTTSSCAMSGELWTEELRENYPLPNAGFVHLDDVDYSVFSLDQMLNLWNLPEPPEINLESGAASSLIHVARTENDWNVYSFIDDNREVEVSSGFGTIIFNTQFAEKDPGRIQVEIGRDGTIRRACPSSDENCEGGSNVNNPPVPIDITPEILDAGTGIVNTPSFAVRFPNNPGRGAVLDIKTTNGEMDDVSITSTGGGYGTAFSRVVTVPAPTPTTTTVTGFSPAVLSVQSNKSGNLVSTTLASGGTQYEQAVTLPVAGGQNGSVRLTPSAAGNVTPSIQSAGTGYSEPVTFTGLNFPEPVGAGGSIDDASFSIIGSAGNAVKLAFFMTRTAAFPNERAQYQITSVSLLGSTTPYQHYTSNFNISGFSITYAGGISGDAGDISFADVPDLEVEIQVSNGVATGATLVNAGTLPLFKDYGTTTSGTWPDLSGFGSTQPAFSTAETVGQQPLSTANVGSLVIENSGGGFVDGSYGPFTDQFGGQWNVVVTNGEVSSITAGATAGVGYATSRQTLQLDLSSIPRISSSTGTFDLTCDENGQLNSVSITNAGGGYIDGSYTITNIQRNGGSGGSVNYTVSSGLISSATIGEAGSNYANEKTFTVIDNVTTAPEVPVTDVVRAEVEVDIDRNGRVVAARIVTGKEGRGYETTGTFPIGPVGSTDGRPTINRGTGAVIAYSVSNGRLSGVSVQSAGGNYLSPVKKTVTVAGETVLTKTYTLDINGVPVRFVPRQINTFEDVVGTINGAEIPSINAVALSNSRILLRSRDEQQITISAQSAEDAELWRNQTGINWFGTNNFALVLRNTASLTISYDTPQGPFEKSIEFSSGTTGSQIVSIINQNEKLTNILASIRNNRLIITSTFNEGFNIRGSSNWVRDIITTDEVSYEKTRLVRQINSGTQPSNVEYVSGLVKMNRRLLGTEVSNIRRTFNVDHITNEGQTRFQVGTPISISSVFVDGVLLSTDDFTQVGQSIELATAPPTGTPVRIVAVYRFADEQRFLSGKVLVRDPKRQFTFQLFDYEFVTTTGIDEWYYVLSQDGVPVEDNRFSNRDELPESQLDCAVFVSLKFDNEEHVASNQQLLSLTGSPYYWQDQDDDGLVSVRNTQDQSVHRIQKPLVVTRFFRNAFVYDSDTLQTIIQLPVYDPFKGLIAGPADRNITYKTEVDPARYTNASDESLVNPGQTFGNDNVGELWWDTSELAYYWYEQGNNAYRRNNWGKLVPGSSIDVYEWTKCSEPPERYRGDGVPKNLTDFVISKEVDPIQQRVQTFYYYWVKDRTSSPDTSCSRVGREANRTLSASEVTRLIQDPPAQNYRWFSPVSEDSFVFSGVDRVFTDSDNIFQINYTRTGTEEKPHVEWELASDADPFYEVNQILFDKMVDSLCEITDRVDPTQESDFGLSLNNYSDAIVIFGDSYLPVPDPQLSITQKYGSRYRPRQTMFKNVSGARKQFVDTVNKLLEDVRLRDEVPGWNQGFNTGDIWEWKDWWATGRNRLNSVPIRRIRVLAELPTIEKPHNGDVVLVTGLGLDPRSSLYEYDAALDRYILIYREKARLVLKNTIFNIPPTLSADDVLKQKVYLRNVVAALAKNVFVGFRRTFLNRVFFSLIDYAYSEQQQLDWAFKTTYINIKQRGRILRTDPLLINDVTESTIDYVNEIKPYRTKIRNYTVVRSPEIEDLSGSAEEILSNRNIKIAYDRLQCSLSATDIRIARAFGSKFSGNVDLDFVERFVGDGVETQYTINALSEDVDLANIRVTIDNLEISSTFYNASISGNQITVTLNNPVPNGDIIEVAIVGYAKIRLGAAGRTASRMIDLHPQIPLIDSMAYQDFFVGSPDPTLYPKRTPISSAELEAIAEINREVLNEMRCEFRGVVHDILPFGPVPWDFLKWDEGDWDGSIEPLVTNHDGENLVEPLFTLRKNQTQVNYAGFFNGGTGHGNGDLITLSNGAVIEVIQAGGQELIEGQDESDYTSNFDGGVGHNVGDEITLSNGTLVTVTDVSTDTSLIPLQTQEEYSGQFIGGTSYVVGDIVTMSNGSTVEVVDVNNGTVTEFVIQTAGNVPVDDGDTLTSTGGTGGGFQLIVGFNNLQAFGDVTEFVITTSVGSASLNVPILQVASSGAGTGFSVTPQSANLALSNAVTQFEVIKPGSTVSVGQTLTQVSTTGIGVNFSITPLGNNLALVFRDVDPLFVFNGNGLQTNFVLAVEEGEPEYPEYLLEVFIDEEPQDRNIDYFIIDGVLIFVDPPDLGASISIFSFIDAGTLRNPQVNEGITQEKLPLDFLDTTSICVNRLDPTP